MTKGKALIEVRRIIGPSGHVRYEASLPMPCKVGTFDANGFKCIAVARSWGGALDQIRGHGTALAKARGEQA